MKIQPDGLTGASGTNPSPPNEALSRTAGNRYQPTSVAIHGDDSVNLSSFSIRISDRMATEALRTSDRVATLAALYERGDYQLDSTALTGALLADALNRGGQ